MSETPSEGAILAVRNADWRFSYYAVVRVERAGMLVLPISGLGGNTAPLSADAKDSRRMRHRAEIEIEADEVVACGIPLLRPIARADKVLRHGSHVPYRVVGQASAGLVARMWRAVVREAEVQAQEGRYCGTAAA